VVICQCSNLNLTVSTWRAALDSGSDRLGLGLVTVTVTACDSLREVSSSSYLCSPGLACRSVGPSLRARRTAGWFFPDLNEPARPAAARPASRDASRPAPGGASLRTLRTERRRRTATYLPGWPRRILAGRFGRPAITDTVTLTTRD
jgi:hypothetical protein